MKVNSGFSRWVAKAYQQLQLSRGFSSQRPHGVLQHQDKLHTLSKVVHILEASVSEKALITQFNVC